MSSPVDNYHEEKCDDNGRNKLKICCQFCPSVILNPAAAKFFAHQFSLPHMRRKGDDDDEEKVEKLNHYWLIEDMYTFENVSVTKTVDNIKYLACADCEIGPIGYVDIPMKKYYIALSRVMYRDKS